jgi:hypothetical protein
VDLRVEQAGRPPNSSSVTATADVEGALARVDQPGRRDTNTMHATYLRAAADIFAGKRVGESVHSSPKWLSTGFWRQQTWKIRGDQETRALSLPIIVLRHQDAHLTTPPTSSVFSISLCGFIVRKRAAF